MVDAMVRRLLVDKCSEAVGREDLAGDGLEVRGLEGVDAFDLLVEGGGLACEEVALGHGEGCALEVVRGDAHLSAELSLGRSKGAGREGRIGEATELTADEAEATPDVGMVATEIDGPGAGVSVGVEAALGGVDKAGALSQGEGEA